MTAKALEVEDLVVTINTASGVLTAIDGVSFDLHEGEVLGLVGESGSGKTLTGRSILRLLPSRRMTIRRGAIRLNGEDITKFDVSIQAQILNLFLNLQKEMGLTMIFIAHDLGVVWHLCQTIAVMYLGRIVEIGDAAGIFRTAKHPYTQALIGAIPQMHAEAALNVNLLPGEPPSPPYIPSGCAFHPRCPHAMGVCRSGAAPVSRNMGAVQVSCHLYDEEKY